MDRAVGEDGGGEEEECNLLMWRMEERERGREGVEEGASVSLERKERYAGLCDSSYIEHSVCVDTVSCIAPRNKLFLLAQYRASSSHLNSSLPLGNQVHTLYLTSIPIVFLPRLWFKYALSRHACYYHTCLGFIVLCSPLPLFSVRGINDVF